MKKTLRIYPIEKEEKLKETFLTLDLNKENGCVYLKEVDGKGKWITTLLRVNPEGEIHSSLAGRSLRWRFVGLDE